MPETSNRQEPKVGVLGLGHVGLPTALGFAELGREVVGTDSDAAKVEMVRRGKAPFFEPQLHELLQKHLRSGRFRALTDIGEAVRSAEILFICVGTPHHADGSADLSQLECAARVVAQNLNGYKLIVEKSTAPVRTAPWIESIIKLYGNGRHQFEVACNPEFLREGTALNDILRPDRVVIGVKSQRAEAWLRELYEPLGRPILVTDPNTAETIKHASNAFLALKISYINLVADLCEVVGADVRDVATGLGLDPRIGSSFLKAGIGYGGFCLPKDVRAFIRVGEEFGVNFALLREVERLNQSRIDRFLRKVKQALSSLKDKRLAVVSRLRQAGAALRLYDPQAIGAFRQLYPEETDQLVYCPSAMEAAEGADAVLVLTEWREFQETNWRKLRQVMAVPVVVDGRNCLDERALSADGFVYYGFGLPTEARREVAA
ncbi:MAG: UDP-glucose 6-dehydrogenase [Acidobacteria bacterium]|nr:MAG: UDP-glucose 6-dehydrogenase [Acidobacteriota bacterium]